tara:strand:- start:318 stop:770 length:453 start_codon:yes stop_codon:yes gene_type:complete
VRLLGVDFGDVRIGLAVSDPTGTIARPLRTITASGSLDEYAAIVAREVFSLTEEADGLDALVVGVPRSLDGTPHQQTTRTLAFVESLRKATVLPVITQDERLTSVEAEQRLAIREHDWRKRKKLLDAASAAVILQDYLDEHRSKGADVTD